MMRACGKGPSGMRFRNGTESRNLLPLWERNEGAAERRGNGTEGKRDGGETERRGNGTEGKRDEGATGRRGNGTEGKQDEGATRRKSNAENGKLLLFLRTIVR